MFAFFYLLPVIAKNKKAKTNYLSGNAASFFLGSVVTFLLFHSFSLSDQL